MSKDNIKTANPAALALLGYGGGGLATVGTGLNNILQAHEPKKAGLFDFLSGLRLNAERDPAQYKYDPQRDLDAMKSKAENAGGSLSDDYIKRELAKGTDTLEDLEDQNLGPTKDPFYSHAYYHNTPIFDPPLPDDISPPYAPDETDDDPIRGYVDSKHYNKHFTYDNPLDLSKGEDYNPLKDDTSWWKRLFTSDTDAENNNNVKKKIEQDGIPVLHEVPKGEDKVPFANASSYSPFTTLTGTTPTAPLKDLPGYNPLSYEDKLVLPKEDTSWWENTTDTFLGHVTGKDRSRGNWIADAGMVAGGLLANRFAPGFGKATAIVGGGLGLNRAGRYVFDKAQEAQKAELHRMGAGTNPQGRTARTEAVASKDDPTNWANWIKENPGKATIGAGLGSALLYNAAGGREGIQQKVEAMRNNPLATVGGLGSLGLLSKITYDAMNKEAEDKDGVFDYLREYVTKPIQRVVQLQPTIQANQAIELKSKNEGNVLSGTDNVIDGVGEYLPAVLGIGALGAAGYGGYRLYDHLREKNSSWNPFAYPKGGSYGLDYENAHQYPERISFGRKAALAGLTGLATAPFIGIAAGSAPALIELGGGIYKGIGATNTLKNMGKSFSRYGKAALIPGFAAGVLASVMAGRNMGKWRDKDNYSTLERIRNIREYNESHQKKGPYRKAVGRGIFRILGGGFDKENAHTPTHQSKYTAEYDHNSLLEGKQKTELPDFLQKEIIDHKQKTAAEDHQSKYTAEYDHNSLLEGKQKTDLPDFLQKHIIDHRSKTAVSVDAMRRYERANLDAGPSAAGNVAAGGLVSLLGGGLAAATGPGGLKSRLLRGTLGALPGVALGALLEDQRQKKYEDLYNLDDAALKKRYTNNKKVMDSLGLDPFMMSNK